MRHVLLAMMTAVILSGCYTARTPRTLIVPSGASDGGTWIDSVTPCRRERGETVRIDPSRPLTLFVPGSGYASTTFQALADVFESHGQQTLCFHYDDRGRFETASAKLVAALEQLEKYVPRSTITVFAHSQGGLVSRHALVSDRKRPLRADPGREVVLVTVATPFRGIASATTCGFGWLHILSLGVTAVVCQSVAGSRWHDIYPASPFIRNPGSLASFVKRHVMIVTDERGACVSRKRDGTCEEEDQTFSLGEQTSKLIESDRRVDEVQLKAGHAAVLGVDARPDALIRVLEAEEILTQTSIASTR